MNCFEVTGGVRLGHGEEAVAEAHLGIENGTHYPLDVSAGEDACHVRQPNAVTVLGILRRAEQGEYRAWARGQPCQRDRTFSTDAARMSRRLNQVIRLAAGPPEGL